MLCVLFHFRCSVCDLRVPIQRRSLYRDSQQKEELCHHHLVQENVLPMSLVEDILDLLRIVLQYFGVAPDMVSAHMLP